jgi:phenylacetate-CoA ligase
MGLFERYMRMEGYDLGRAAEAMARERGNSRSDLDAWREQARWAIARFHAAHNAFYGNRIGGSLPSRWEDLPVFTKRDYQAPLPTLLSEGYTPKSVYRGNTSGSSGQPFVFAKDKEGHARTWALIAERYGWHGITLSSLQARFYGIPLERIPYMIEKAKDLLMARVRFPVFDLSDEVLEEFLGRFRSRTFVYMYGYTNSMVLFARYLNRKGIILTSACPSLRVCVVTSEVCTPEDQAILAAAFGVPVVREYGASEVGIIAFDSPGGDWIVSEENLFIEIVDDTGRAVPDGQAGAILVTDLHNRAEPFIRYNVGDIGVFAPSEHDPVYGRKRILTLQGRINDTVLLPSGKRAAGMTFYYVSRSILESSGVLREFIVRQTGLADFVFDVVSDRDLTAEEEASIRAIVDKYLEPGLHLTIRRVPAIVRTASGKTKHFYSELT